MFLQDLHTHTHTHHNACGVIKHRLTYMLAQAGNEGGADGKLLVVAYHLLFLDVSNPNIRNTFIYLNV